MYGMQPGPAGHGAASIPIPDPPAPFGKTESTHLASAFRTKPSAGCKVSVMHVTA
jgi:hypothetical protein